ncbi:unnamed protein product [Dovyalis caffra]|uniref:Uncharacterized protein n=1 Tax=Dovyalis caffra TaxID=77055 RepID=A0AAV1RZT7_9ROSI|nr:unnamed protein product [Dovyalis caffra]
MESQIKSAYTTPQGDQGSQRICKLSPYKHALEEKRDFNERQAYTPLVPLMRPRSHLCTTVQGSAEWRRSGQIPAFGNWDQTNELPITQYFESARQAGLIRYSTNSSGECGHQYRRGDLYASDFNKPSRNLALPRKGRMREKRGPHVKELRKQGKVCDVTEPARKQQPTMPISMYNNNNNTKISHGHKIDTVIGSKVPVKHPKAVDEDLYKIPPELLRSPKRVSFLA